MKQLAAMPRDLAVRIHHRGFVPIKCDCGGVFAWDLKSGRTVVCPTCRKTGDPVLESIAAPPPMPALSPAPPRRIPGMPSRAEFEHLPAFAANSLASMSKLIDTAKKRLGDSEERFKGNIQNVHGVADMYDAASQQVETMMKEMEGNGGPPLSDSAPSSQPSPVLISPSPLPGSGPA